MWLILIPMALCGEAVYHDLKRREIPDSVSLRILLSGFLATALSWHSVTFVDALVGMLIGFMAVLPFTLLDGIGGGDLKLVAALGAWLGPWGTFALLFWTAMSGMVLAIIAAIRKKEDYAYAPAIFSGLSIAAFFPQALPSLVSWLGNL